MLRTQRPRGAGRRGSRVPLVVVLIVVVAGCSDASVPGDDSGLAPLVGDWRGVLLVRGQELPFRLRVNVEGETPAGAIVGGDAETPIVAVSRQGAGSYTLSFSAERDSELVAKLSPDGRELSGYWRSVYDTPPVGPELDIQAVQLPFSAAKEDQRRFQRNDPALALPDAEAMAAVPDVAGIWEVALRSERFRRTITAPIDQDGERVVADDLGLGAGPLVGIYRNGLLRLSAFNGFGAVLLHARATSAGTLEGTLWILDDVEIPVSVSRR